MHSSWFRSTFIMVLKFLQIKENGRNFKVEPILQKVWIISCPVFYFSDKSFMHRTSSSFIRFQSILHNSLALLSESWNFCKLKRGGLISVGNQFWRKSESFGTPFCISILKVLRTQFLRHSLASNASCLIQGYLSQTFGISTN